MEWVVSKRVKKEEGKLMPSGKREDDLLDKYKIKWFNLPYEWHTYLMDAGGKIFVDDITKETVSKAKLIHLINKRFEELWKVI